MTARKISVLLMTALVAACASGPPHSGEVVTMKASEAARESGLPKPGTVWRLDDADLKALSPAPICRRRRRPGCRGLRAPMAVITTAHRLFIGPLRCYTSRRSGKPTGSL